MMGYGSCARCARGFARWTTRSRSSGDGSSGWDQRRGVGAGQAGARRL